MKYIAKQHTPKELLKYKATTPNASYDGYPDKESWSDFLLQEQGYVCAYTLMRIEKGKMKKEHIISQCGDPEIDLNHNNVVAVCKGNEGKQYEEQYADTRKGSRTLDSRISPLNKECERYFRYNRRGEVCIDDIDIKNQCIDYEGNRYNSLLNLNHTDLIRGRLAALDAIQRKLGNSRWRTQDIEDWISISNKKNKDGKFLAYCKFISFRLEKALKKNL